MEKIPVSILGATGAVGQRLIQLLDQHPFFEIVALAASEKSAGKKYGDVVQWKLDTPIPDDISKMLVSECRPDIGGHVAFSGLDSNVAGTIEAEFARAGIHVVSNAKNFRMEPDVPLIFPEVNPDHLAVLPAQKSRRQWKGSIVTNSNCSIMAFLPVLHVLDKTFGVSDAQVVTMQAISGAGYPGVPSLDILGNVVPNIKDEEDKIETEPLKILGQWTGKEFKYSDIRVSASVNRVAVLDGHLASLSVKLKSKAVIEDMIRHLESFRGLPQDLELPLAPKHAILVHRDPFRPQPRLDAGREKGMAVHVGRIRACPILDFKMTCLVHNTIRGAAGAAILNAELLKGQNLF